MPLSKERMRKRKRLDRLTTRFDGNSVHRIVKPTLHNGYSANQSTPTLDADGQPIPDYY